MYRTPQSPPTIKYSCIQMRLHFNQRSRRKREADKQQHSTNCLIDFDFQALTKTISDHECKRTYSGDAISTNIVCTTPVTGSSCRGDSGSFAGSIRSGKPEIDAVISFGAKSCEEGIPVGCTEVYPYIQWILEMVLRY